MGFAKLDRVALVVEDLEAVAKSLRSVFDIDLKIVEAQALGLKAGVGNSGIELVQKIAEEPRVAKYWRPPLAALCIHVEDIEEARQRMEAAGFQVVQTATTHGGLKEYFYGDNFHGLPLVLLQSSGDLLHDIGEGDGEVQLDWQD
jgi:predicted enzyme related to lactoylglutathione lyase